MSSFAAEWLALREPYDLRARNPEVLDAVVNTTAGLQSISVVDLACGTGSTLRALSPPLVMRQQWRLCDNDLGLLARAVQSAPSPTVAVTALPLDLARDLEAALDGAIDLVTTSALLDLVSAAWLERLTIEIGARRLPLYAALSYDGRLVLEPAEPEDDAILAAVNAHQRSDKGFGAALGPEAARQAIARFEAIGYRVVSGPADWVLSSEDRRMQMEVLGGWAAAARDMGDLALRDIAAWLARRRDCAAAGISTMRIGHVDFFACPNAGP